MQIDQEGLMKLSAQIKAYLDAFVNDRRPIETQWVKNLRQHLGKYDPEVKIPQERSQAYPRDTRVKIKGYVAKMMELMFPSQEKNWELATSEIPSIAEKDLAVVIQGLEQQELLRAQQEQREPFPITSDQIERAVRLFAEQRKEAMEKEIQDQLDDEDTDHPDISKRVVRSGAIYGFGVARFPMVRKQKERVWELDKTTGQYRAVTRTERRPYHEYVRIWNIFPDLSAQTWREQDRIFERMIFNRYDFSKLAKRGDFIAENIKEYLKTNQSGNYREQPFETTLRAISHTSNLSDKNNRRYEVYRHLGFVSGHDMARAGVEVSEDELAEELLVDIWMIDNTIIKAEKATFGERPSDQYPAFIPTEDEDSGLTGVGKPEDLRDSQLAICAATRAQLDNMAATAGPIFEVNTDLLKNRRQGIGPIHAFMTVEREGEGNEANVPAIRSLNVDSHVTELQTIIDKQRQQLDVESNLPAWTFGQTEPLGEAFRTSQNMSMMTGGANMITKDDVRAFDRFVSHLIGGYLKWNMEFNSREDIKGDFQVRAKGNLSLVAKEVRGAALDQFIQTMTPEDRAMFDMYGINLDRLKSRDLPVDRLLSREEAARNVAALQQAQQQAQQIEQGLTQAQTQKHLASAQKDAAQAQMIAASADATIQEILSRVTANLGRTKSEADRVQLENLKTLLEATVETGGQNTETPAPTQTPGRRDMP